MYSRYYSMIPNGKIPVFNYKIYAMQQVVFFRNGILSIRYIESCLYYWNLINLKNTLLVVTLLYLLFDIFDILQVMLEIHTSRVFARRQVIFHIFDNWTMLRMANAIHYSYASRDVHILTHTFSYRYIKDVFSYYRTSNKWRFPYSAI